MNSRERVCAVLDHRIPDRVPNGLGGAECTGLHVVSYDTLQKISGVPRRPPRIDTYMTNAVFEDEVLKAIEGDILLIATPKENGTPLRGEEALKYWKEQELWGRTFRVPVKDKFTFRADGSIVWDTRNGYICPQGNWYFDDPESPGIYDEFEYPDPEDYKPWNPFTDEFLRDLENTAKRLFEETEYSLCLGDATAGLNYYPGGRVRAMMLLVENPDLMRAYLEKSLAVSLEQVTMLDQAVGKYVDILNAAQDFGDNRGVMIGEETWRMIYKPYYHRFFQGWHQRTAMKINFHCCGSIEKILPDLIECGLDIYNPVQISAANMAPENLKERFGRELVFYGGDYDARMMQGHRPEDVYEHVKHNLNILKKDGGHVFCGVHNLPADTSEEHLRAMIEAYKDNRGY